MALLDKAHVFWIPVSGGEKLKRSVVARVLQQAGIEVYRRSTIPRSIRLEIDLARILSNSGYGTVVIDVGANVGQTAVFLKEYFPDAKIWCIEPIQEVFDELEKNVFGMPDVICRRLALTADPVQHILMKQSKNSLLSRVVSEDHGENVVKVPASTLDEFVLAQGVDKIDFLKVDAEGHDLEVLKGANGILGKGLVSSILCEVSLDNDGVHTFYEDVAGLLRQFDFICFGFYGFSHWEAALRGRGGYTNALFVKKCGRV